MMFNKTLVFLLALAFSVCFFLNPALNPALAAVSFKDQKDINGITWAKDSIIKMAEKGIISGMDGYFKPRDNIKKLDSLIMVARLLGSNDPAKKSMVDQAENIYSNDISDYNIYGRREVSYLIYTNTIPLAQLDGYIGNSSKYANLLRYEAAILLVKALGREDEVQNQTLYILPYNDQDQIPERAKPYVYYLYKNNIMMGTSPTEFTPMIPVTRAQMAVLLTKVAAELGNNTGKTESGVITSIDSTTNVMVVKSDMGASKSYTITNASVKLDEQTSSADKLGKNMKVKLKLRGSELYEIDASTPSIIKTVQGIINSITIASNGKKVKIDDGSGNINEYAIDTGVDVVRNGDVSTLDAIKNGDSIKLEYIDGNIIYRVVSEDKNKTISGIITTIVVELPAKITIMDSSNTSFTYDVEDDITVKRNTLASTLRNMRVGDSATLTLEYSKVKKVEASGSSNVTSGRITGVLISKQPKITVVNSKGETDDFDMINDAIIKIENEVKSFYDLRVGYYVDLSFESNIVVKVEAKGTREALSYKGTITDINLNIGIISLDTSDEGSSQPVIQQVYLPRDTTTVRVTDAFTGALINLSDIKKGSRITAYGYMDTGVFIARNIVLVSK